MLTSGEVTELKALIAEITADIPGWTHGTFLKMADRATHLVYSNVGHVLRIKGLKIGGQRRDVTSHLSGGWGEKLSVLKDGGAVGFFVHFDRTDGTLNTVTGIAAAALAQTKEYFQLTFADGTGFGFQALVSVEFDQPVRGKTLGMVVLDISGPVTPL
ncbi:MAG TPA: hypothetical protein VGK00_10325 [Anaerolineales bacterium]|jgi:hypothetical protein